MKINAIVALLATTVSAYPTDLAALGKVTDADVRAEIEARAPLEARQSGSTANELVSGACRPITFIFARGSTEPGNLGITVGPLTCNALKNFYGASNVACQGVGSPYVADLASNALPEGTTSAAWGEAIRLFNLANTKCPNTIITAGGYSQGAAVMTASVRRLSTAVKNKIAGVVLYGNTRNAQTGGKIPDFDRAKSQTYCDFGDGVCLGTLIVTAAHLTYADDVPAAARYLENRVAIAGGI